jgi:hypothetical protein
VSIRSVAERAGSTGLARSARGSPWGRRLGATMVCRCARCGYARPHMRGVPCSSFGCPTCGKRLHGEHCGGRAKVADSRKEGE